VHTTNSSPGLWQERAAASQQTPVSADAQASDFVLGVDLDGVCADFMEGLRPIAAEWLCVPLEELTPTPSYNAPEWGFDEAHFQDLYKYAVTRRNFFRGLPPVPRASLVLRKLWSAKRPRIRIITHRLYFEGHHRAAISQTVEWLDRWAFPYWDICFMKRKDAVEANLYIEDNFKNVTDLRRRGKPTIAFLNSTNAEAGLNAPKAQDWDEVEKIVLDEIAHWERAE
jgi:5'(3')-deoxyribonucleotidase